VYNQIIPYTSSDVSSEFEFRFAARQEVDNLIKNIQFTDAEFQNPNIRRLETVATLGTILEDINTVDQPSYHQIEVYTLLSRLIKKLANDGPFVSDSDIEESEYRSIMHTLHGDIPLLPRTITHRTGVSEEESSNTPIIDIALLNTSVIPPFISIPKRQCKKPLTSDQLKNMKI
jgi:hypothetical protein